MARKRISTASEVPESKQPRSPGLAALGELAGKFKAFRPAREVLTRVRALPTIFPWVDHATRVRGWPIERVTLAHGESNHGKTILAHGLGLSFLQCDGVYGLIDAEHTTPITWLESLFGPYADASSFLAMRPKTYESAVDETKRLCEGFAELREKGRVPPHATVFLVVDSVRKLLPEDILARVKRMGAEGEKGSVDGFGGRAAQYRAALNAAWLDTLVPLMAHTKSAIMFIAREAEDPAASAMDKRFGNDFKVSGGKSLYYESSLVVRVSRASSTYVGGSAEEKGTMVGERIAVTIMKTKVSARQANRERAYFHVANGREPGVPEGFDRARDLFELGKELGIVKAAGAWWGGPGFRAQGEAKALEKIRAGAAAELEMACREKSAEIATKSETLAGGEVDA